MNYYPAQLEAIVVYLKHLDQAEKAVGDADHLPFPKAIPMTDDSGFDFGVLRDEIGGAWSWSPPKGAA